MTAEEIHQVLAARFGERVGPLMPAQLDAWCKVEAPAIIEVCTLLKKELAFDGLMNLTGVDWPKKNQIQIVYHLYSYSKRHSFVIKVELDRAKPELPSVESVWKAADWLEREQYDLLGVNFTGHPDLRRLMMPDDWIGHPLRKDYQEQAKWHNISTTRESPLDGFVRLDELRKRGAADAATAAAAGAAAAGAAAAGAAAAGKETVQ